MQEVVDKNTADLIVVPLFLLRPVLALRFVELTDHFEASLVTVVAQPIF